MKSVEKSPLFLSFLCSSFFFLPRFFLGSRLHQSRVSTLILNSILIQFSRMTCSSHYRSSSSAHKHLSTSSHPTATRHVTGRQGRVKRPRGSPSRKLLSPIWICCQCCQHCVVSVHARQLNGSDVTGWSGSIVCEACCSSE